MWQYEQSADYKKGLKKWPKKYGRELASMIDHLDTLLGTLNDGVHPEQAKRNLSFIHGNYPLGILSIVQRGGGSHLKATRLYVYPDQDDLILHLLILGDKDSQPNDVASCTGWVKNHLSHKKKS